MAYILRCDCYSEFQDREHGRGMRVHNQCKGGSSGVWGRCTVCLKERLVKAAAPAEPAKKEAKR